MPSTPHESPEDINRKLLRSILWWVEFGVCFYVVFEHIIPFLLWAISQAGQ